MSTDLSIYIGQYIKVTDIPKVEIVDYYFSCLNHHKMVQENSYCSKCGAKSEKISERVETYMDINPFYNNTLSEFQLGLLGFEEDDYIIYGDNPGEEFITINDNWYDEEDIGQKQEIEYNNDNLEEQYKPIMNYLDSIGVKYQLKFGILSRYW